MTLSFVPERWRTKLSPAGSPTVRRLIFDARLATLTLKVRLGLPLWSPCAALDTTRVEPLEAVVVPPVEPEPDPEPEPEPLPVPPPLPVVPPPL